MLSCVDEGIGNVTKELERRNMLSNTLFVFTSDNGGPIQGGDSVGARNWPLRGGKHSIWEGGVRATSVVYSQNEDLISVERRGTTYNGLMHGADWFPTLSDVAGYDLNGTLELDGVSQWSAITGTTVFVTPSHHSLTHSLTHLLNQTRTGTSKTSPRKEVVLGNATDLCSESKKHCGFAIRAGDFKLIRDYGGSPDWRCNTTAGGDQGECDTKHPWTQNLTTCPNGWCLFNVLSDPYEMNEASSESPRVLKEMQLRMKEILTTYRSFEIDPDCPNPVFTNDSSVGKSWAPWC